ncbi:hypothetical protein KR018_007011, partial [Drosophila ironensis]
TMKRVIRIFHKFALIIGLTSYNEHFRQTRITQAYALIINIFTLSLLPIGLREAVEYTTMKIMLPKFMQMLPCVLFTVNYIVIAYTLISRSYRDRVLMDMEIVILQLNREMRRTGKQMSSNLRRVFLAKTFTLTYLCVSYIFVPFLYDRGQSWIFLLEALPTNLALTILITSTFIYFVSFWQIAKGYDFVNQQLEEFAARQFVIPSEELRSLWSLHANLSRTAKRINKLYGPQMLASRFDYCTFTIINAYIGSIYTSFDQANFFEKLFGSLMFWIRTVDFFLNDCICGMVTQYQSRQKAMNFHGTLTKEMSSYLIYENSIRLNMKVCGLYPVNKNKWLQMMGSIVVHSVVLMQFHMAMSQ